MYPTMHPSASATNDVLYDVASVFRNVLSRNVSVAFAMLMRCTSSTSLKSILLSRAIGALRNAKNRIFAAPMNQVLAIGLSKSDMDRFPEMTAENTVFRDSLSLTQLRIAQHASVLLKKLETASVQAYSLSKYLQIIEFRDREYTSLSVFEPRDLIDFQLSGCEQLLVMNNDNFSVMGLQNRELEETHSFPATGRCVVSGNGVFLCLFSRNELEIRAGCELGRFNKIALEEEIVDVSFSPDSRYVAVFTRGSAEVWDVFRGCCLARETGMQPRLVFDGDVVHFLDAKKALSLVDGSESPEDVREIKCMGNQAIVFTEDRVQRVQYTVDGHVTSKTQANIQKIEFYFSEKRCFALIVKNIQKEKVYFLESYSRDEITLTQLAGTIEQVEVSNNFFVAVDSKRTVSFYTKDRFGFRRIKEIKKEEDVLIALRDNICCLYDSDTDNVEFYDNGELRSVYSHQACSRVEWSHSGLYVASVSAGDNSSGLVQVFNRNGKLLWKKVFNKLSVCVWRPFIELSSEEKAAALEGFDESAVQSIGDDENARTNVSELLSMWKSYLLSKKQNAAK